MAWFRRELKILLQNVRAGARLMIFRRDALRRIKVSMDQIFLLVVLDILLMLALDWAKSLPHPAFNSWGFVSAGFGFSLLCLMAYVFAQGQRNKALFLRLAVAVYSASPWLTLIQAGLKQSYPTLSQASPWSAYILWWVLALWFYAVIGWIMLQLAGRRARRVHAGATLVAYFAVGMMVSSLHVDFFYTKTERGKERPRQRINAEEVFDAQPELLQKAVRSLHRSEPGAPALYFLGFASYAGQDVFRKETLYARDLLDNRFGTRGRSLVMINHAETAGQLPLASGSNLRRALKMLGGVMNRNEDVLFIYLTSHGSEKQGLSAQFWPLSLNDIPAEKLKSYLDEAGIRWRVLLVSSCYSGRFIDVLKDDYSLVMTASAADKQSFGCSNENDFTYFGEAVFKDSLSRGNAFIPSFQSAITAIREREAREKLDPSSPQLFVGARIGAKLAAVERRRATTAAAAPATLSLSNSGQRVSE